MLFRSGVSSEHILKEGKKLIQKGWNQWIDHVDYIFCYENYMKNPKQIIQELADLVNCKNINIEKVADIYLWYTDLLKKEEIFLFRSDK